MAQNNVAELTSYYDQIRQNGNLLTANDAQQWSKAVLRGLGIELPGGVRKDLARALPEELAADLQRKFILFYQRDRKKTAPAFLKEIALMSGNTDAAFARLPTTAVFHELKAFAGPEVSDDVAESLAPELSDLWQRA